MDFEIYGKFECEHRNTNEGTINRDYLVCLDCGAKYDENLMEWVTENND